MDNETKLVDGTVVQDRRLDRLVQFDERSRNFPVRALLQAKKPRSYTWSCGVWLDQGYEGACVGFSVTQEAAARPVVVKNLTDDIARQVYKRAQQLDPWDGEDYEGTSVLAGIKVGEERGWYEEYRWAFGLDDLILAVGYAGPAVLGVNWYTDMFDTDDKGYLHVGGEVAGGHAILCHGVNVKGRYFKLHNSWGKNWGVNGEAKISFDDMNRLLHEYGEACIPVKRTLGTI